MRHRLTAAVVVLAALAVLGGSISPAAEAARGSDPFVTGRSYSGDFPDPFVLRVGRTYYGYSTNTANLNLPTMVSTDLETWTPIGDTFPRSGSWARSAGGTRTRTWAPSVTYVGDHYVLAYTAPIAASRGRKNCVGVATADSPRGPFVDPHSSPMVCPSDQGAIDPQVYVDGSGNPYLLWKTEGVVGHSPTRFWIQQLDKSGTSFADGSEPTDLMSTELGWEGHVIENPDMIRVNGLTYLFYSANEYVSSHYAIGYAVCTGPLGPCVRPSDEPLLSTGDGVSGPGGPSPFLDKHGRLRLAYAAWTPGQEGYPRGQRRLHVATLKIDSDGLLHVVSRG